MTDFIKNPLILFLSMLLILVTALHIHVEEAFQWPVFKEFWLNHLVRTLAFLPFAIHALHNPNVTDNGYRSSWIFGMIWAPIIAIPAYYYHHLRESKQIVKGQE